MGPRRNSTMELFQEGQDADIEYFFASDASAIIEHTNRVIYLEVRLRAPFERHSPLTCSSRTTIQLVSEMAV